MPTKAIPSRTLTTVIRKLRKSLVTRGVLGTAKRCVTRPVGYAYCRLRDCTPYFRQLRKQDREWDQEFGVDTYPDMDVGWMAEIESPNWMYGRGYHPAPAESLKRRLAELAIDYEDFIFIDFGSGKGRSLLVAAEFPFQRIIGVEYAAHLHEIAERNIATYKNPNCRCARIEAVHEDAARFAIPPEPAVYYFYDPFDEPVMRPVVDAIIASLKSSPRKAFVVYYNPVFAEMFEDCELFERRTYGEHFLSFWEPTLGGNKNASGSVSEKLDPERYVIYETID